LEPDYRAKAVAVSQDRLFVIAAKDKSWRLLGRQNNIFQDLDLLPINGDKDLNTLLFYAGAETLTLIMHNYQYRLTENLVYRRDGKGWHEEAISSKRNCSLLSFWQDSSWAICVSLKNKKQKLFFRS